MRLSSSVGSNSRQFGAP